MKLLLVTPAPNVTESLLGYVLRLSERNGYDTPWHILSFAGFNQSEMKTAGFPIQKLASVLGRSTAELEPLSYRVQDGSKSFKLLGQPLGGSLTYRPLRLSMPAFCPACVDELGFIDAFWDLRAAVACPRHGHRLLESCSVCANPITWYRPGLFQCKCGADLRDVPLEPVEPAVVEMMQIIVSKVHGHTQLPNLISRLPVTALWKLSLRSLLDLLNTLGNYAIAGNNLDKLSGTCIVSAAVAVLDNWPLNFHTFLRKLDQSQVSGIAKLTLRKRFEVFYVSMFKKRKSAVDFTFLKKEFIHFGATEWGEGIVDQRMIDGMETKQRFMSKSKLAEFVGVDKRTLTTWASQGKIQIKSVNVGGQTRYIADAAPLASPSIVEGRYLDERAAAKFLGLPVTALSYLKASGRYVVRHMPVFKRGYHQADLMSFQEELCSKSVLIAPMSLGEDTLSLEYVMQEIRFWSRDGKGAFIAAYLDGEISSPGRTGDGIGTICFLKIDVVAFASLFRMQASKGAISLQEAAKIIGCTSQAVKDLIGKEYLESSPAPAGLRVTRESVMRFVGKYACLHGMAGEHRTTVARLKRLCDQSDLDVLSIECQNTSPSFYVFKGGCAQLENLLSNDRPKKQVSAVESLKRYLENLQKDDVLLPRRAGSPNLKAIAAACNFERSVFYKNLDAQSMLLEFSKGEALRHRIRLQCRPIDALKAYLANLTMTGTPLPRRGARPNMRLIAEGCGFKRDLLYSSSEMQALIEEYSGD
ncbi:MULTISPECIES: TniQ family protein [Chromobacterium]|uniref:TniQ family protein n=1 Tax=Chromobacterium TaxID=535 RepID=UPI001886CF1E|nr:MULTISPECIES: TniQ family protein [Chromobacterium]QOZ83777.1 hypothetical protein DXT74_12320 [Chromobacterium sp. Rain0013]WON83912.1 TniQ family protein [Chromobacterium haemolyticum]